MLTYSQCHDIIMIKQFSPTKSEKVLAGAKVKKEDLGYSAGCVLGTPV